MCRTTKDRDGKGTGRPEGRTRVTHGLWQRPEAGLAKGSACRTLTVSAWVFAALITVCFN